MKEKLTIIKVGGKIVEEEDSLRQLLTDFSAIPGAKILVHGGGRSATKIAAQLGVETKMIGGRRVTDRQMLDIVTMVYGGLVNKSVVARLQAQGVNALGLTGADMNVIRSHKRPVKDVDYGFVGDVDEVDGEFLADLIRKGIVPVMAPLTHDGQGQLLNTNADTIAGETAKAMARFFDVTLVYCFEKKGVLRNADDDESVIPHINEAEFKRYVEDGTIQGGMIPKLENSFDALHAGVAKVVITLASAIDGTSGSDTGSSGSSLSTLADSILPTTSEILYGIIDGSILSTFWESLTSSPSSIASWLLSAASDSTTGPLSSVLGWLGDGASYVCYIDGENTSLNTSVKYPVVAGGIAVGKNASDEVTSMRQLMPVLIDGLGAASATSGGTRYETADDMQVYLWYKGQYFATTLSQVNPEEYYLIGWWDNMGCAAGNKIRVLVAVKKD